MRAKLAFRTQLVWKKRFSFPVIKETEELALQPWSHWPLAVFGLSVLRTLGFPCWPWAVDKMPPGSSIPRCLGPCLKEATSRKSLSLESSRCTASSYSQVFTAPAAVPAAWVAWAGEMRTSCVSLPSFCDPDVWQDLCGSLSRWFSNSNRGCLSSCSSVHSFLGLSQVPPPCWTRFLWLYSLNI